MKKEEFKKQEEKMKERKKKEKKNEEKGEKEDREDINKDFPALCWFNFPNNLPFNLDFLFLNFMNDKEYDLFWRKKIWYFLSLNG